MVKIRKKKCLKTFTAQSLREPFHTEVFQVAGDRSTGDRRKIKQVFNSILEAFPCRHIAGDQFGIIEEEEGMGGE